MDDKERTLQTSKEYVRISIKLKNEDYIRVLWLSKDVANYNLLIEKVPLGNQSFSSKKESQKSA